MKTNAVDKVLLDMTLTTARPKQFFQPIGCGVLLLVLGLMSLGPGTQSFGVEHLSLTTAVTV